MEIQEASASIMDGTLGEYNGGSDSHSHLESGQVLIAITIWSIMDSNTHPEQASASYSWFRKRRRHALRIALIIFGEGEGVTSKETERWRDCGTTIWNPGRFIGFCFRLTLSG